MMEVYPIYLRRLNERKTVIIGGDSEAEAKVEDLLERKALLTVISSALTERLQLWADQGRFTWIPREYREGDLERAFMAIVADFEGDVNERVYKEAEERGILVNVMDDIPHANFAFGAIVKQGPLTISISTSGAAPALAVRLRQRFEKEFGEEYAHFLEFVQKLRKPLSRHYPDFSTRKKLWYELIDSDVLEFFREGQLQKAYNKTAEIMGKEVIFEAIGQEIESKPL